MILPGILTTHPQTAATLSNYQHQEISLSIVTEYCNSSPLLNWKNHPHWVYTFYVYESVHNISTHGGRYCGCAWWYNLYLCLFPFQIHYYSHHSMTIRDNTISSTIYAWHRPIPVESKRKKWLYTTQYN